MVSEQEGLCLRGRVQVNPTWDRYEPAQIPQPRESPIPILSLDPQNDQKCYQPRG